MRKVIDYSKFTIGGGIIIWFLLFVILILAFVKTNLNIKIQSSENAQVNCQREVNSE